MKNDTAVSWRICATGGLLVLALGVGQAFAQSAADPLKSGFSTIVWKTKPHGKTGDRAIHEESKVSACWRADIDANFKKDAKCANGVQSSACFTP